MNVSQLSILGMIHVISKIEPLTIRDSLNIELTIYYCWGSIMQKGVIVSLKM